MSKKTLKNIFAEKINKKEIYNDIINESERKISYYKIILTSACIIVLFCIGFVANYRKNVTLESKDEIYMNDLTPENRDINCSLSKDIFSSEEYTNTTSMIDENKTYSYSKKDKITNNILINISLPSGVYLNKIQKVENHLHDYKDPTYYNKLLYQDENGFKKIAISYSQTTFKENNSINSATKTSKINNLTLAIYQNSEIYMTYFRFQDQYYEVVSQNLNEEEFINLLKSIIKKK